MSSIVQTLSKSGLAHPPQFLPQNIHYETIMGSQAYGIATSESDFDIYGFCIPPLADIFPHLRGEIPGFGRQINRFEQYQEQGLETDKRSYDLSIYSIVRYFHLVMENNPNMVDSLFTPANCVLHITHVGQMVRDNRELFLHKGYFHKARGYAYSSLCKTTAKTIVVSEWESKHGLERGYSLAEVDAEIARRLSQSEGKDAKSVENIQGPT